MAQSTRLWAAAAALVFAVSTAAHAQTNTTGGLTGTLLIGFFDGHVVEKFDHAVVPAYRWPVSDLCDELVGAGFDVVETHARTTIGQRSHGAILALR